MKSKERRAGFIYRILEEQDFFKNLSMDHQGEVVGWVADLTIGQEARDEGLVTELARSLVEL